MPLPHTLLPVPCAGAGVVATTFSVLWQQGEHSEASSQEGRDLTVQMDETTRGQTGLCHLLLAVMSLIFTGSQFYSRSFPPAMLGAW